MKSKQLFFEEYKKLLINKLFRVRNYTEELIKPLEIEDLCLQGMPDASPPKWHLGHTTWFFERLILKRYIDNYKDENPKWDFIFNSYYESLGRRQPRAERGIITRPTIDEVLKWRSKVTKQIEILINKQESINFELINLIELGINHEEQHQELLLMDILDGFSRQPLEIIYDRKWEEKSISQKKSNQSKGKVEWIHDKGGLREIGRNYDFNLLKGEEFCFDNECPQHKVWIEPFEIGKNLITNKEYYLFIEDGGYKRPELWMSEGWQIKNQRYWEAPRYWKKSTSSNAWHWEFTLNGIKKINPSAPVRHISWFEADAFSKWANSRLPTEAEWEIVVRHLSKTNESISQANSFLWQWTSTPYKPYPGFKIAEGAIGEYNGKFMTSQYVLRGSSYLTPKGHERNTYRNFFPPYSRWMASGIRLAR